MYRMPYSWRDDAPVSLDDLCYITLSYYNFKHQVVMGELVIHKVLVDDIAYIFSHLFEAQFPIESMKLVDEFNGSDIQSMAANNTSAFYARKVAGTDRWSNHSYGCAIDINPLLNPYSSPRVKALPAGSEMYVDRHDDQNIIPGMITTKTYIYKLFKERGWQWGGECFIERDGVIDRHHFQKIIPGMNFTTN